MKINCLKLTNYRNHIDSEYIFDPELTLILGPNGSGKTNILEAIHTLATTKPFRAEYYRDIVNHQKDFSKIESTVTINGEMEKLTYVITKSPLHQNTSTKKVMVNGVPKSMRDFSTKINTVLFSPEDLEIVTGSPSRRRSYIDSVLIQTIDKYKKNLTDYTRCVRQRNKVLELLNEQNRGYKQIDYWDKKVSELGEWIQNERDELFKKFNESIDENKKFLNGEAEIEIKYTKNLINPERLKEYKKRELATKTTLIGPHRDDFEVILNGKNIANFGSRGQQRSVFLILKLAEIDFLLEKREKRPILLLDDIFSELDKNHKQAVLDLIHSQQTIITSTEKPEFVSTGKEIVLENV